MSAGPRRRTAAQRIPSQLARIALRRALQRAGRGYLAGSTLEDALGAVTRLGRGGAGAVVSYWQADCDTPATVAEQWCAAIGRLGELPYDAQVALKAPGLGFDEAVVASLTEQCRAQGMRVWFDSHEHAAADPTLAQADRSAARGLDVGVAVPARWLRSRNDVLAAMERGHAIRLVKGQLPDPGFAVRDVGAAFLSLVDLCAGRARFVAVATHDATLLDEALGRLSRAGTPCEAQLLLGLPLHAPLAVARRVSRPVRFYVAYGHPSLVYSPQSLWENRRIALWLARDLLLPPGRRLRSSLAALSAARPWASADGAEDARGRTGSAGA